MRHLTLLRHARAHWPPGRYADHDRPLDHKGIAQARAAATAIAEGAHPPDLILCSSALRTRQTAQFLREALALKSQRLICDPRLYLASPRTLIKVLQELSADARHVVLVGHNPGLSELAEQAGAAGELGTADFVQLGLKHVLALQ
jgi:phosphohistidine phosphatase